MIHMILSCKGLPPKRYRRHFAPTFDPSWLRCTPVLAWDH